MGPGSRRSAPFSVTADVSHRTPPTQTNLNLNPSLSRALAGLSGGPKARIFAGRFNAELVAIGDVFTTCDQPNDLPGAVPNAPTSIALDPRTRELAFQSFKV